MQEFYFEVAFLVACVLLSFIMGILLGVWAGKQKGREEVASGKVKLRLVIFEEDEIESSLPDAPLSPGKEHKSKAEWVTDEYLSKTTRKYLEITR